MSFFPFRILYSIGFCRATALARRRSSGLRYGSSPGRWRISLRGEEPCGRALSDRLRPWWMADRREAHRWEERGRRATRSAGLRPNKGSFVTKLIALLVPCTRPLQTKTCNGRKPFQSGRGGIEIHYCSSTVMAFPKFLQGSAPVQGCAESSGPPGRTRSRTRSADLIRLCLQDNPTERQPHATDHFAPDRPNKQQIEGAQALTRSLKVCDHPRSDDASIDRGIPNCDNAVDEEIKIPSPALKRELRR